MKRQSTLAVYVIASRAGVKHTCRHKTILIWGDGSQPFTQKVFTQNPTTYIRQAYHQDANTLWQRGLAVDWKQPATSRHNIACPSQRSCVRLLLLNPPKPDTSPNLPLPSFTNAHEEEEENLFGEAYS